MTEPVLTHVSPLTAYRIAALTTRHNLAPDTVKAAFAWHWLAVSWKHFITDFGGFEDDIHRGDIALTQAVEARRLFLGSLAQLEPVDLLAMVLRLQSISRTSSRSADEDDPLALIELAAGEWASLTSADLVKRVAAYVERLRAFPEFAEGEHEYSVLRHQGQPMVFERAGQRSAAWAANLGLMRGFAGFESVTPLPCYGLVTREMLRPDVSIAALPILVDRQLASTVLELGNGLSSLQRDLPSYLDALPAHGDGRTVEVLELLLSLGPLASYQLPTLLGCNRSTSGRAVKRLVGAGLCTLQGRVLRAAPALPRWDPIDGEPAGPSFDFEEFDAAMAQADAVLQRHSDKVN